MKVEVAVSKHGATETMRLIRELGGERVWRWGKREIIYLSLRGCHHQNDFCIEMASDETILMFHNCEGQSHKTTTFEEKGEPKQIRTEVLLLTSLTP